MTDDDQAMAPRCDLGRARSRSRSSRHHHILNARPAGVTRAALHPESDRLFSVPDVRLETTPDGERALKPVTAHPTGDPTVFAEGLNAVYPIDAPVCRR